MSETFKKNKQYKVNDDQSQSLVSLWTSSETVEMNDGSTLEARIATLESDLDWKEAVATYDDLATTYPNPEDGWTVNVKDTDYTYRYSGTEWIAISANAIPEASQTVAGKMSAADKTKLDGIDENAKSTYYDLTDTWSGTKAEFDADFAAGKISEGAYVNISDDTVVNGLAAVATTGAYADLSGTPTIYDLAHESGTLILNCVIE